jgi:hypothetical protein
MTTTVRISNESAPGSDSHVVKVQQMDDANNKWPEVSLAPGDATTLHVYQGNYFKISESQ